MATKTIQVIFLYVWYDMHRMRLKPYEAQHFKVSVVTVSKTYWKPTLIWHLPIYIAHTKIVSDFKNPKSCEQKSRSLSKSLTNCI